MKPDKKYFYAGGFKYCKTYMLKTDKKYFYTGGFKYCKTFILKQIYKEYFYTGGVIKVYFIYGFSNTPFINIILFLYFLNIMHFFKFVKL